MYCLQSKLNIFTDFCVFFSPKTEQIRFIEILKYFTFFFLVTKVVIKIYFVHLNKGRYM